MIDSTTTIIIKRGTAEEWAAHDDVLEEGELGIVIQEPPFPDVVKSGDGRTPFSLLDAVSGERGPIGLDGAPGDDSYAVWLAQGNQGTVADFLEAYRGPKGDPGAKGDPAPRGTTVNVLDFGADNSGATDAGGAILRALASLNGQPGTVYLPGGIYLINNGQPINLQPGQALIGEPGATRLVRRNAGLYGVIRSHLQNAASQVTVGTLTADGLKGSRTLSVSSVAGIVVGQYVQVFANRKLSPAANNNIGEMVRVSGISGTTLTLTNGLSTNYLTSDSAAIRDPHLQAGITLADLIVESETMDAYGVLVYMQNTIGLNVHNLTVRNSGGAGLVLDQALDFRVDGITGQNLADDDTAGLFGYVVNVNNDSENGIVSNIVADNVRHGFTTTGVGAPYAGQPRNILVTNGVARNCPTTAGWDTHADGTGITMTNLRSFDCAIGFQLRSPDTELSDSAADRSGVGILLTAAAHNPRVRDVTISNTYTRPAPVGDMGNAVVIRQGAAESPSDVLITDLLVDTCEGAPIKLSNVNATNGTPVAGLTLSNSKLFDGGTVAAVGGILIPDGVSLTTLLISDVLVANRTASGRLRSVVQKLGAGSADATTLGAQVRGLGASGTYFDGFTPTQYTSGLVNLDKPAAPNIGRGLRPGANFYYGAPGTTTTGGNAEGAFCAAPVDVDRPATLSALLAEITSAGSAGAALRLGVYEDDGTGTYPGALVVDAGTIDGTVVATASITLNTAVKLKPGRYWVGGAVQGGATTKPATRNVGNVGGFNMPTQAASANTVAMGSAAVGVSGALPATHPTSYGVSFTPPRIMMRLS